MEELKDREKSNPPVMKELKDTLRSTDERPHIQKMQEDLLRLVSDAETSGRIVLNRLKKQPSGRRWSSFDGTADHHARFHAPEHKSLTMKARFLKAC